jgi:ferredoxin-like protein FixX
MFSILTKIRRHKTPKVDPATLRTIEQTGYTVASDGSVECATCGTYCGQCGGDRSAPDVATFMTRMNPQA